jgi:hypothetical protein
VLGRSGFNSVAGWSSASGWASLNEDLSSHDEGAVPFFDVLQSGSLDAAFDRLVDANGSGPSLTSSGRALPVMTTASPWCTLLHRLNSRRCQIWEFDLRWASR